MKYYNLEFPYYLINGSFPPLVTTNNNHNHHYLQDTFSSSKITTTTRIPGWHHPHHHSYQYQYHKYKYKMTGTIPPISTLKTATFAEVTAVISQLFEPTSALSSLIYENIIMSHESSTKPTIIFNSYDELIEQVRKQLLSLEIPKDSSQLDPAIANIIGAHPRLGSKKVDSPQSQAEQASLRKNEQLLEKVRELNILYEKTFPGLRYVVFVNGRPLPEIIENLTSRIARNNFEYECKEAFNVSNLHKEINKEKQYIFGEI